MVETKGRHVVRLVRLATKGGKGGSKRAMWRPSAGVIRKGLPQRDTEARNCPIKEGKQVVVQEVTVDVDVVHVLGHVSTLPGEHHLTCS